jgi:virginiamycin B lyase
MSQTPPPGRPQGARAGALPVLTILRLLNSFYVCVTCICCLILLVACGGTSIPSSSTVPIPPSTTNTQPTTTSAIMAIGSFREYSLPQSHSGLMRPAIDHEGRLWFGEMGHNYLAVFDPRTQTFQQMTPPHGHSGIMGVAVAPDDTIWFAEQYANYIGHYFPSSEQYRIYSLPILTIPDPGNAGKTLLLPSAPNDIALDTHGGVWFTELNADSLGRLDTATGNIRQYPLSAKKSIQTLDPYGITVDQQGMVWFTESSNNHLGRLDPATGKISLFTMPGLGANTTLMEIASDAHGTIWATTFTAGLLLSFNPHTSTFTPYYVPSTGNSTGGLYGLTVTAKGQVWVTVSAENVIARLDVVGDHFVYYPIPTKDSVPLGVVMGANNTLWFTEAGSDKIGMLEP